MGVNHTQPREDFGERPELGGLNHFPLHSKFPNFPNPNNSQVKKTWRVAVVGRGWQEGHPDTSPKPSRYFFPLTQCEHPNKL